jgi:cyclohexanecarboxylate-CoA ligase
LEKRAETDGRVIGDARVRVVDAAGDAVEPGGMGEIEVCGPELFTGYLDPGLADKARTPDGWFRTGDLGVLDADGYLAIGGRTKDIIIRGGENISAKEVENLLLEHPAIVEVAVVAMPDAVMGEKACAFVVCADEPPPALAEVVAFLEGRRIARQKLPERPEIVDPLPGTQAARS